MKNKKYRLFHSNKTDLFFLINIPEVNILHNEIYQNIVKNTWYKLGKALGDHCGFRKSLKYYIEK